jgi:hypothetical protein
MVHRSASAGFGSKRLSQRYIYHLQYDRSVSCRRAFSAKGFRLYAENLLRTFFRRETWR